MKEIREGILKEGSRGFCLYNPPVIITVVKPDEYCVDYVDIKTSENTIVGVQGIRPMTSLEETCGKWEERGSENANI